MKLIIAYIQPERLNAVKQALFAREIYKMSVTNALGCGKQGGYLHLYRGAVEEVTLHKKMRLAIAVNDHSLYRQDDRGDHRRCAHGGHRRRKDLRPSDGRVREDKNRRARPVGNRITNGKANAMEDERQKTNDRGSLSILCLKS